MKIIEMEYETCGWCGDDQVFPGDLQEDGKCKQCFVEDCSHKPEFLVRQYEGSNNQRVRFTEMCIRCNAFREIRLYFDQGRPGKWDHDEVHIEEWHQ